MINKLSELFKFKVPYLDKIIEHELYESLTKYSVKLLIIGVVLFILTTVFNKVFVGIKNSLANTMDTYVTKQVEQDREIDKENDGLASEHPTYKTHIKDANFIGAFLETEGLVDAGRRNKGEGGNG